MSSPTPFRIAVPQEKLDYIHKRLADYRWFPAPSDDNWQYGMKTGVLKDIVEYWLMEYDWRAAEDELNRYPHFKAEVDGLDIHFLHVVGEVGGKRPLLISHGWPGSVYEFWACVERLAYPSRFGGDATDAFDLIIPSLPGYGWSGKPDKPLGQKATAALWDRLMTDVLGYENYLAQGGDWGSVVTSWLGFHHGEGKGGCCGIHLNMIGLRPTPATPQSDEEIKWLTDTQIKMAAGGSYLQQQATKPQSLAIGLMDSPMGQAAWILEKFHGWSDLGEDNDLLTTYSKDALITNLMIYLVNDAFATSVWYYNGLFGEGGNALPDSQRCETPTAFANFKKEALYAAPPRSWVERAYNLTRWSDFDKGGHFAAMEQPEAFCADLVAWGRETAFSL